MSDYSFPEANVELKDGVVIVLSPHEATEIFLLVALSDHRNGLGGVYAKLGLDPRVTTELQKRARSLEDVE